MLILPLIDLLILAGTGLLGVGFILKAVALATVYRPSLFGFTSLDFVLFAGICWGLALTLSARTWVKLNEPRLLQVRRERMQAEALRQARDIEMRAQTPPAAEAAPVAPEARTEAS